MDSFITPVTIAAALGAVASIIVGVLNRRATQALKEQQTAKGVTPEPWQGQTLEELWELVRDLRQEIAALRGDQQRQASRSEQQEESLRRAKEDIWTSRQTEQQLRTENATLRARVSSLEAELSQLRRATP